MLQDKLKNGYHVLRGWRPTDNRRILPLHWVGLVTCILVIIITQINIIRLSSDREGLWINIFGMSVYKSVLSGIIAQVQVMLSVFIVLNPIKFSYRIALLLNVICISGAFRATFFLSNSNALPGIVIPLSTILTITIIRQYGKSLHNQIKKVIRYNQIMKDNDELLHRLAFYDTLTELPNRTMIIDQMINLTWPNVPEKSKFIFVLFDLDNFKKINDSMGHSVGDIILKKAAQRWMNKVHPEDLLGRVGGDEFALLIRRDLNSNELMEYVESFRVALSRVIAINRKEFFVNASFGITIYPQDGSDTTEIFKNAEIALYKAKNEGKNGGLFFNREMQGETLKRIQLENGLLSSIRNNELYMVFQPIYNCDSKTLRGFEALARWKYPEIGLVSPAQFIPIAEETGIIIEMGRWIIITVLKKFMELQELNRKSHVVSINISVVQMIDPSFVPMIKEILEMTGFDSRYLELEITETVFITYPDHIIDVIKQLKELGIRIALDDFGTGYASLSYLQILPINVLKIDKTFIDQINRQNEKNQIVGNIISLAHQLGIEVVAEGVEQEDQLNYLKEQNCDFIQGYLLSKPIDEEQLTKHYSLALNI